MNKKSKILVIGLSLLALIAVAGTTMAFVQEPEMQEKEPLVDAFFEPSIDVIGQAMPGVERFKGREVMNEALAQVLGISVEELQSARETARSAALEQAAAEGLISEERAEIMRARAALASVIEKDEIIARALGITAEDLQVAREEGKTIRDLASELDLEPATVRENLQSTHVAVLQQAVADGLISQEQADLLAENPRPARPGRPGLRARANRVFNERSFHQGREIWDVALADALGITVGKLQNARQEALEATLDQAVAEGVLPAERAEIILARAVLMGTLDPDAILAQVPGITIEDLQAARDQGQTLAELAEELDLDPATVRENLRAAREQVIQQAVEDGLITAKQAELLRNRPGFGFRDPGRGRPGGFRPLGISGRI